jgi:hypothetical protein
MRRNGQVEDIPLLILTRLLSGSEGRSNPIALSGT